MENKKPLYHDDGKDHSECGHANGTDLAHCVHQERSQVLIDAAFQHLDQMATALTDARRQLSAVMDQLKQIPAPGIVAELDDVKLTMNLCIIASRKLVKGEML